MLYTFSLKKDDFMEKNVYIAELLDAYRLLLTDKQADMMSLYYEEDLSLAEIKEHYGITRQAVLDNIRRAEKQLLRFEEKLGLVSRRDKISAAVSKIRTVIKDIDGCAAELIESELREMED